MARYIRVPKDMDQIKEKFAGNLTKRQLVCFLIGGLCGIPVYFLTKGLGLSVAVLAMGLAAAPAIICGLYSKNGLFFEDYFKLMVRFWKSPKIRTYQSETTYQKIEDQIELNECLKRLKEGGKKIG